MIRLKIFNSLTGEYREEMLAPEKAAQQESLIGRTETCDLVLESPDVSRSHVRIQAQENSYTFTDLGSANGTLLNREPVKANQSYPLTVKDLLSIGDFELFIDAIAPQLESSPQAPSGDRPWTQGELLVRCDRITAETADVKTFTFTADPPIHFNYQPGQFVTLELDIQGESVLRSYSISSTPSRPHTLEISVKRVPAPTDAPQAPAGLVSNWLHDHLKVGSQIKLSGPLGKFTCGDRPAPKLLFLSAGSGITPMMSMSRWLTDTLSGSDIIFYHCARTPADIIFRQELELMSARYPNFHLALSITRPEPGHPWYGFTGRLTADLLRAIAPDFQERTVYVCGPEGFMQATKTLLLEQQFPPQNYHEESFGAPKKRKPAPASSPVPTPTPAASGHSVMFSQSDRAIASDGSESILELAEQANVKIRSNCRQGVCGACKKRKLEGQVRYDTEPDALDPEDQAKGYILTCVACPIGRVVIEA